MDRVESTRGIPWAPAFLALLVLAGGGSTRGGAVEAVLVAISIVLLCALTLLHLSGVRRCGRGVGLLLLVYAAVALLAMIQILPVAGPWTQSPLHRLAGEVRDAAGLAGPHMPISLDPHATWRFLASLSIPVAVTVAVAGAGNRERRQLLGSVVLAAGASVLLALLQASLGTQSWLEPYGAFGRAKGGLLNNVNHQGMLLILAMLAATAIAAGRDPEALVRTRLRERRGYRRDRRIPPELAVALIAIVMLVGIALSRSLAAVALSALAIVAMPLALRFKGLTSPRRLAIGGGLLVVAAMIGAWMMADRLTDPGENSLATRLATLPALLGLARDAFPWGTGLGSFVSAYRVVEPLETLSVSYLNHAHHEPLHWLIETGLIGAFMAVGIGIALGRALARAWREAAMPQRRMMIALTAGIILAALHSLVDFPLRTTSVGAVIAAFLALLLTHPPTQADVAPVGWRRPWLTIPALIVAALFAVPAFRLWTAQHHVANGSFERALRFDPGHPQALAGQSWRLHKTLPLEARADAVAGIEQGPLNPLALRTLLLLDSSPDAIDTPRWRLADRLGRHDRLVQTILTIDTLQRGDSEAAARHVVALLRRRSMSPEIAGLLRTELRDVRFRAALIEGTKGDPGVLAPMLAVDARTATGDAEAVAALATDLMTQGYPLAEARFAELTARLLEIGSRERAVALEQARANLLAKPRFSRRSRSPFQFAPGSPIATRVRVGAADRLFIKGAGQEDAIVASRALALRPGRIRIGAMVEVASGTPRAVFEVQCPGRPAARSKAFGTPGPVAFQATVDCHAPMLSVRILNEGEPYELKIQNWTTENMVGSR